MKITYDEQEDVLRILLTEAPIETVNQNGADQTLDYDRHGTLVGLEMRNTLSYMNQPGQIDVSILPAGEDIHPPVETDTPTPTSSG